MDAAGRHQDYLRGEAIPNRNSTLRRRRIRRQLRLNFLNSGDRRKTAVTLPIVNTRIEIPF
jgi:hypothetical protein